MFRLAYNTNGLAHHRLDEAFVLLADLGYEGVAVTPDVGELDPYRLRPGFVRELRTLAEDRGLALAVETGARFVLDPARKHRPSLLEDEPAGRARRVDFYRRSIDLAVELGAPLVSIWSGVAPGDLCGDAYATHAEAAAPVWDRLVEGVRAVLDHARGAGVRVAFEPEPGMFLERPAGYHELVRRLGDRGSELGLTLDVGHLLVTGDLPVGAQIRAAAPVLAHVHLDDIRAGVHEHRLFGSGDLDLDETVKALMEIHYGGMAAVELSRDSHRGAETAARAMLALQEAILHTTSA